MAGRIGRDANGRDGMCGVVIDGLDLREGVQVVLFCVDELRCWVGRRVPNTDAVLDEPLVDGLSGMCHEDTTAKVGLGQDVRE